MIRQPPQLILYRFSLKDTNMVKKAVIVNVSNRLIPSRLHRRVDTSEATALVRAFLEGRGFRSSNIIVLSEGDDGDEIPEDPTYDGIIDRMRWLTRNARSGDELFFYYGGHGSERGDICPLDYSFFDDPATRVKAKDMLDNMVSRIPEGCRLTTVFDTCHAGGMLNLKYRYGSSKAINDGTPMTRSNATSARGVIINFAACSKQGSSYKYDFTSGLMDYLDEKPNASFASALRHVINDLNVSDSKDKPEISCNRHLHGTDSFFD
ncbi:caspase domain-containing protein [Crassisporium funariophilum]|nr:caspase domain-containing protein [Crassisporium funariophilum]